MEWLLRRFRGRESPLVCFLRENGPIAYQTALFTPDARARAEGMLATGLSWYWKTTGAAVREWTELSRWSLAALLADLDAGRGGVAPRLLAIAIDPQDTAAEITDPRVAGWMRAFNAGAAAPLHAVVACAPAGSDLLFVAQQPPEPVRGLLRDWGIDRDKALRRAYARLHGNALEDLLGRMR